MQNCLLIPAMDSHLKKREQVSFEILDALFKGRNQHQLLLGSIKLVVFAHLVDEEHLVVRLFVLTAAEVIE